MKYFISHLLCISILFFGCGSSQSPNPATQVEAVVELNSPEIPEPYDEKVEDGFYLILNTWEDSSSISPSEGKVISFSHDFLGDNTDNQPLFIEVDTTEFVPLSLSKEPEGIEQEDKRIKLLLSMTDSASLMLERFTEKNLNGRTCIVIGGKAVTKHKIKQKIIGGKLQVTRCTDNACKHLLLDLEDNFKP